MKPYSVYNATRGYLYHNQGLRNDLDFWSLYSGLSGHQSWTTHADSALSKNGYTGSLNDMLLKWSRDLTGKSDWSFNDNVLYFFKSLPSGLTFFKNYDAIPNQTSADASLLNANLSVGSGVATFTSTDSNFTINGGYSATTANDDVLKYLIANNRTAEQETIVIKFQTTYDYTEAADHRLIDTDTKQRQLFFNNGVDDFSFYPNYTDSSSSLVNTTGLDHAASTDYVITCVCNNATSPYVVVYWNGVFEASDTDNYTIPPWGTYFYIGAKNDGTSQLDGTISKVAIFNRALSASDVATVTNLL